MKKYKTINFLEEKKEKKKSRKLFQIVMLIGICYLTICIYYGTEEIQNLQDYISENEHKDTKIIEVMSYQEENHIDINKIKAIYDGVGRDNITSLIANDSNIEIEGSCYDLNTLNNIKNYEYINEMSVNKIKREGEAYIFNISYRLIDK